MSFGMWTKQCATCGHHEHLPDICIVGTEAFYENRYGDKVQVLCMCNGQNRNDV